MADSYFSEVNHPTESVLNPLANCFSQNRAGSGNEVSWNYTLNPFTNIFSPQILVENHGEIIPHVNSDNFSVNIIPESSPPGLMFAPMDYYLPANCFSPVQIGPSNLVRLNHTLNPLANNFRPNLVATQKIIIR